VRRFYRVTDPDGLNEWLIPDLDLRERFSTPFRASLSTAPGSDGAYDLHGSQRSPVGVGKARLDALLEASDPADPLTMQTVIDAAHAGVAGSSRSVGLRKLWRREDVDNSAVRWSYARPQGRLEVRRNLEHVTHVPVRFEFELPDPVFYEALTQAWLVANSYTAELVSAATVGEPVDPDLWFAAFNIIVTSPFAFTIKNIGPLETRRVIFRLQSNVVNGFTNPSISNTTTGQSFSTTTDGPTATSVLSVNASPGLGRARTSGDGGLAWTDDTVNLQLGSTQAVIMELAPGDNVFSISSDGTPDYDLLVWWAHGNRD